jgi:NAD(P)-dependent dehydrogenase (short-subunit alcohol dehydrogenase family)
MGTRAALKRMKPRDRGVIVQVGSALAYRSLPLQAPYCAAKAALRGFTDALRSELIHDKSRIHVTMVHLSAFNTPQFDWGRTCMRDQKCGTHEIASLILKLQSWPAILQVASRRA